MDCGGSQAAVTPEHGGSRDRGDVKTGRDQDVTLDDKRAEPPVCPTRLRRQSERRLEALLRYLPAGAVFVDADLTVVECNEAFARMFDESALAAYEARPGLVGARLQRLVPFSGRFRSVLDTGQDIRQETLRLEGRIFSIAIFSVEPHRLVGGIVRDVTSVEISRTQIAHLAQEVIHRHLDMVQEVACRLGESVADTEILLRSLADGNVTNGRVHDETGSIPGGKP
jgi:PAS domain-containing protein